MQLTGAWVPDLVLIESNMPGIMPHREGIHALTPIRAQYLDRAIPGAGSVRG
jgi:CheY-like chemotaxis protein